MIVSINHKVFSIRDIQLWPDHEIGMLSDNDPLDLFMDRYWALLSGSPPLGQRPEPAPLGEPGRPTDWVH